MKPAVQCSACRARTGAILLIAALLLAVPARAASRPRYGGTLRLSFFQAADTYDPVLAATLPEQLIAGGVYETLVGASAQGTLQPGLAARWQAEAGGKRWIFYLRTGARFHNGTAVTAAAVRASLERALPSVQTAAAARLRRAQVMFASPAPDRLACDAAEPLPLPQLLAGPALAIADSDGSGTGPWRVAAWTRGVRVRLEAFEGYARGRPFLDAVEAEFGSDARRQRVDFELKRADVLVTAPTEARLPFVARPSPPSSLLLLAFHPAGPFGHAAGGESGAEARRLLAATLDRDALARLLPPGRADAAEAFLPGWLSGYEFLFARPPGAPAPPSALLPRGAFRLVHDAGDSVARLIASRLALDLRAAGIELRPEPLPHAVFLQARDAGQYDMFLESVRLRGDDPGAALADILQRYDPERIPPELWRAAGLDGQWTVAQQYRIEQWALGALRAVPLLHDRDLYVFQAGLEQVRLDDSGMLDLANAWKP